LSFHWKKGSLLEALESGKILHVVLENPPLDDPWFSRFLAELQGLRRVPWADQSTAVADNIQFYQTTGYDWDGLREGASLHRLGSEPLKAMTVLSDANIRLFINDPSYTFSKESNRMQRCDSFLTDCQKNDKSLDLVCSPQLSRGSLAQLLSAAKE